MKHWIAGCFTLRYWDPAIAETELIERHQQFNRIKLLVFGVLVTKCLVSIVIALLGYSVVFD